MTTQSRPMPAQAVMLLRKKGSLRSPKAILSPSCSLYSLRLDFSHPLKLLAKELHQVGKTIQQICRGGEGDSVVPDPISFQARSRILFISFPPGLDLATIIGHALWLIGLLGYSPYWFIQSLIKRCVLAFVS